MFQTLEVILSKAALNHSYFTESQLWGISMTESQNHFPPIYIRLQQQPPLSLIIAVAPIVYYNLIWYNSSSTKNTVKIIVIHFPSIVMISQSSDTSSLNSTAMHKQQLYRLRGGHQRRQARPKTPWAMISSRCNQCYYDLQVMSSLDVAWEQPMLSTDHNVSWVAIHWRAIISSRCNHYLLCSLIYYFVASRKGSCHEYKIVVSKV